MAEGPLVHRCAARLAGILHGAAVEVQFGVRRPKTLGPRFVGARIEKVEAKGKQSHIHFSDGRVTLVHLLMGGSWGFYRRGVPLEVRPDGHFIASREQCEHHLEGRKRALMEHFYREVRRETGTWTGRPYLNHSRLSSAMNLKLLDPREAVRAAEMAPAEGAAPLSSVERFVRQIVGWREYVRGSSSAPTRMTPTGTPPSARCSSPARCIRTCACTGARRC